MAILDFWKKKKTNADSTPDWLNNRERLQLAKDIISKRKVLIELKEMTQQLAQKEIKNWRMANQIAIDIENPKRNQLYDIYYDAMLDDHLLGAIRNRKLKVMRTKFKIADPNGQENTDLNRLLQSRWFKKFMSLALDSIFYGHSLIQLGDIIRDPKLKFTDIELVPRKHVVPEYHVIIKEIMDEPKDGVDYLKPPFSDWTISVGEPKDLGLLLPVAKDTISKKYALQFWDQFAEIFGMPIRVGKSSTRNKKDLDKIESMLEEMGSAAWGLFPEGTEIEIVESKSSGTGFNVYDKRVERANSEMSKAVLGQTMTMDNGSSRSQALVHAEVAQEISEADADWLKEVINDDLFPVLIKHGFPLSGYEFDWDHTYEYKPDEMRQIEEMLLGSYEINPDYFVEKYNIQITGVKQQQLPAAPAPDPQKKKLSLYKVTRPEFPEPCCEEHTITLAAGTTNNIGKALIRNVWDNRNTAFNWDYFKWLSDAYTDALVRGWKGIEALKLGKFKTPSDMSLDYSGVDHLAMQNMELNIFRFSAAKSAAAVTELNQLARNNDTFGKFRKEAEKVTKLYNEDYLHTEYNFAWNTGHTSAAYYRNMRLKEQFPTWVYTTAGDARVRDAHRALEGKKFKAGAMDSIYPPNGWGCRCYVKTIPGVPNTYTTEKEAQNILASHGIDKNGVSEWDRMVKNHMNVNRAKTRVIYDEDKFYIKDKMAQKLTWKDQGLKAYKDIAASGLSQAKTEAMTLPKSEKWIEKTVFTDYNKRPFVVSKKTLKAHSGEDRLKLLKQIPDILNKPNEVYIVEDGRNNKLKLSYIKYYKDMPVLLIADITGDTFNIITWYEMDVNKVDGFRNGILINKQ